MAEAVVKIRVGLAVLVSLKERHVAQHPPAHYATFLKAMHENGSASLYFGKHTCISTHKGRMRFTTPTVSVSCRNNKRALRHLLK